MSEDANQPEAGRKVAETTTPESAGMVFDIQRYALHDGPGIRTTVFFKGCPLACLWCHNPEGQNPQPDLMYFQNRCLVCGECVKLCPHGAVHCRDGVIHTTAACQVCGSCTEDCPAGARKIVGRRMTVAEVLHEIQKDVIFTDQSGGGATFSGGEPLAQPRFLAALLDACRARRIQTVVETCGLAKQEVVLELSDQAGLFLYDLKILDAAKHKKYTGVSNDSILANLEALAERRKRVVVRYPVIPFVNDDPMNVRQMVTLLSRLRLWQVHLLPYHEAGTEKYKRLNLGLRLEDIKAPPASLMKRIAAEFERAGIKVKVGG